MTSPALALQDVIGDAIIAQLTTDGLTADVVTNPTQNMNYPYVVIGSDSEQSEDTNKGQLKSSLAHDITVHGSSLVSAKEVAKSVVKAVGPSGGGLSLGADHYIVQRELEANDITPEFRPEGTLYHVLVRIRYTISHR